ncbi:MAG: ATP-binding protein, partial [Bdellovibrionales bacterium]|nr:ATP-binding protein [Bdellovibrionales bacterium]
AQDLSEIKQAEIELNASKQQLSLFYQNSPFGFAFCDMSGKLIDANKKYEHITGYNLTELRELSYWDITPKKYEDQEAEQLESLRNTGKYGPYRKEYINKNGQIVPVELNGFIIKDFSGEEGIWSIIEDISEQIDQEKEIQKQKQIASHHAKLASIGELAAGVGHEINNPLAIIKGYLGSIEKKMQRGNITSEDLNKYIGKINLAADRIAKIVGGLRTFSRSDSTEVTYFSPIDALRESYHMVDEIYDRDGINISLNVTSENKPTIHGNRGKFQQIIMNLITNARDATLIKLERKIDISAQENDNEIIISVKDNGQGIPQDLQERVFDPFFTTKDVNVGTGIGLSLTHNFVKEMGGTLNLFSIEGVGTTFTIHLPLSQCLQASPHQPQSMNNKTELLKARVILAEDEEEIRELLGERLENFGLEVVSVENGQKAHDLYINNPENFDLIISDMKMPIMSGPQLLKSIRENSRLKQPKFIFITGGINIDLDDNENELSKLIDGYFLKPFDEQDILKVLSKCLKEKLIKIA